MKTIGLLGGMSWESSTEYYRLINEAVARELGGLHSAKIVMHSVDFAEIESLMREDRWVEAGRALAEAGQSLERACAHFLVLCTNTLHKVASAIEAAVHIPLLHIVDPTAVAVREAGISRVGLLGTRFTMEDPFYRDRLNHKHGLHVLVPEEVDREAVHRIIFDELCLGRVEDSSRDAYRAVIARLADRGAEAMILGCTEISLLVGDADSRVPLFDTTRLHALAAVAEALR